MNWAPTSSREADDEAPMARYNRQLAARIDAQLQSGLEASLHGAKHCVVRTGVNAVLTVLPADTGGDAGHVVFGPAPFAACIAYVNTNLVDREARPHRPPHPHPAPQGRTHDEDA